MWYEILPSAFIITAALGLPGWGLYHIHNLTLGNHYRRSLLDRWDRHMYQRDLRLTGNPYNVNDVAVLYYIIISVIILMVLHGAPDRDHPQKDPEGLDCIPDKE